MDITLVKNYFRRREMVYPSYQEALLFAITEIVEALEDTSELGDVQMMVSIAYDRSGKDATRLAALKIAKKLSETQAYSNKPLQYSKGSLTKEELDVLRAVGELVDALVHKKARWVRNNPSKERSLAAALEKITKAVEAIDESAKKRKGNHLHDPVAGGAEQDRV